MFWNEDAQELYDDAEKQYRSSINYAKQIRAIKHRVALALEHEPLPEELPISFDRVIGCSVRWSEDDGISPPDHPRYIQIELVSEPFYLWKEEEDKEILAGLMRFFKMIFKHPRPEWTERDWETARPPRAVYEGLGEWDGMKVVVKFRSSWPAPGCEIKKVTKETYQVTCAKP